MSLVRAVISACAAVCRASGRCRPGAGRTLAWIAGKSLVCWAEGASRSQTGPYDSGCRATMLRSGRRPSSAARWSVSAGPAATAVSPFGRPSSPAGAWSSRRRSCLSLMTSLFVRCDIAGPPRGFVRSGTAYAAVRSSAGCPISAESVLSEVREYDADDLRMADRCKSEAYAIVSPRKAAPARFPCCAYASQRGTKAENHHNLANLANLALHFSARGSKAGLRKG